MPQRRRHVASAAAEEDPLLLPRSNRRSSNNNSSGGSNAAVRYSSDETYSDVDNDHDHDSHSAAAAAAAAAAAETSATLDAELLLPLGQRPSRRHRRRRYGRQAPGEGAVANFLDSIPAATLNRIAKYSMMALVAYAALVLVFGSGALDEVIPDGGGGSDGAAFREEVIVDADADALLESDAELDGVIVLAEDDSDDEVGAGQGASDGGASNRFARLAAGALPHDEGFAPAPAYLAREASPSDKLPSPSPTPSPGLAQRADAAGADLASSQGGAKKPEAFAPVIARGSEHRHGTTGEKFRAMQPGVIVRGRDPAIQPWGVDANHLHGVVGVDMETGKPVFEPLPPKDWSKETFEEKRIAHTHTCFNLRHSDSLPLDRAVPDSRHKSCLAKHKSPEYQKLPDTSVIFIFYNEPISPLMRSIHSVLHRTPPELLKEIILIDDGSDAEWMGAELERHVRTLPKVILKRIQRSGLMVARTEGALLATGQTLTFLDSHIECNVGWAEPLLARIKEDRKHVVMPIIDSIDADSFVYHGGGVKLLGFTWTLGQDHSINTKRPFDPVNPNPSPVMAGGLFSMDRQAFYDLGTYDQEMRLYGGEEMEIGFRIWQCGYTLECVPCSRVGHIFRTGKYWKGQVYPVPYDDITRNKLRAATVWMDEYADIVVKASATLPEDNPIGDISARKAIRDTCLDGGPSRPFKWVLDNIYPELFVPLPQYLYFRGAMQNADERFSRCVDSGVHKLKGTVIGTYYCHGLKGTQDFLMTKPRSVKHGDTENNKFEIRFGTDNSMCFDASKGHQEGSGVTQEECHGQQGNQAWFWVPVDPDGDEDVLGAAKKQLVFDPTGFVHGYATTAQFEYNKLGWIMNDQQKCLAPSKTTGDLELRRCDRNDAGTTWRWAEN